MGQQQKKSQASIYYIDINEGNKQQNILLGLFCRHKTRKIHLLNSCVFEFKHNGLKSFKSSYILRKPQEIYKISQLIYFLLGQLGDYVMFLSGLLRIYEYCEGAFSFVTTNNTNLERISTHYG